jgi:hypothetical protein
VSEEEGDEVERKRKTREQEKQNILNVTCYPTEWQKSGRGGENNSKEVLG